MADVHVRVNGWCDRCGGLGLLSVEHVDVTEGDAAPAAVTLALVAEHVRAQITARLAELEAAHGCEGAAAKQHEAGRLRVIEHDMWEAVGLPVPVKETAA